MKARMWAAILEWNESHISEAFLQSEELEPEENEKNVTKMRDGEADLRRRWFLRIWDRILNAATPEFPNLDAGSDHDN